MIRIEQEHKREMQKLKDDNFTEFQAIMEHRKSMFDEIIQGMEIKFQLKNSKLQHALEKLRDIFEDREPQVQKTQADPQFEMQRKNEVIAQQSNKIRKLLDAAAEHQNSMKLISMKNETLGTKINEMSCELVSTRNQLEASVSKFTSLEPSSNKIKEELQKSLKQLQCRFDANLKQLSEKERENKWMAHKVNCCEGMLSSYKSALERCRSQIVSLQAELMALKDEV